MVVNFSANVPTLAPVFIHESLCLCALAAVLVAHRFYQVYTLRGWVGVEEGMVFTSLVFLMGITAIGCYACYNGFGFHIADLRLVHGDLKTALECFFLFQVFYKVNICFNKLAFLTLYLRLFPGQRIRRIIWGTIAVVIAGTVAFTIATIFECLPIEHNWNRDTKGHCINEPPFRWAWAGFNTLTDLWICLLPLPTIYRLQMSPLKRFGASIIFLLGLFIVATSALRMKALVKSVSHSDTTWDSAPAFIWSHVEASVGLINTCLPSLKAPISRMLPKKIAGTSGNKSSSNNYKMRGLGLRHDGSDFNRSLGVRDNETVFITTTGKGDLMSDRESQDRILESSDEPGIVVRREVSVLNESASDARDDYHRHYIVRG